MRPTTEATCTANVSDSWKGLVHVPGSVRHKPHRIAHTRRKPTPLLTRSTSARLFHITPITNSDPFLLSTHTRKQLDQALSHALADSTFTSYGHMVARFTVFCDQEQVPPTLRWPADEFVLCAFAASHSGRVGGAAVRSYISTLKAWHTAHNVPWLGSAHLAYVLSGVENLTPARSKQPPRPPITRLMLQALYDNLDFADPFDVAVLSAALSHMESTTRYYYSNPAQAPKFNHRCILI